MYLVVFYVCVYVMVCGCVGVWVCIQNRKVQNSLLAPRRSAFSQKKPGKKFKKKFQIGYK
jgi:hypothetical protein